MGLIGEKVDAYVDKFGNPPKTIVFDSVSRIFNIIENYCNSRYTGFNVYSELNKDINKFVNFIEEEILPSGINVIIISHSIYDENVNGYQLVSSGKFKTLGSFYSVVDNAVAIEIKSNKRIVHHRNPKMLARTVLDYPDKQPMDEYDINKHIKDLEKTHIEATKWEL
jgi:hypothetical protein